MTTTEAAGTFEIAGKSVSRLGFGTMRLTGRGIWGQPDDRAECVAVLRPYVAQHVPRDQVDDILQETMLRLHQRQSQEPIDNFSAYAFQTARSVMADRSRRAKVRWSSAHSELHESDHPVEHLTPERVLFGQEAVRRFVIALEEMPERTRDIFVLHRFEELSYAQIAEHMEVSLSAVGKHMVKALRFLAQRDLP